VKLTREERAVERERILAHWDAIIERAYTSDVPPTACNAIGRANAARFARRAMRAGLFVGEIVGTLLNVALMVASHLPFVGAFFGKVRRNWTAFGMEVGKTYLGGDGPQPPQVLH